MAHYAARKSGRPPMMSNSSTRSAWLAVLVVLVTACGQKPAPAPQSKPVAKPEGSAAWTEFANEFIENYFVVQPFFAVSAGRHEFDGKMPDLSAEGIKKDDRVAEARARAGGSPGCGNAVGDAAHRAGAPDQRHRHRAFLDGSRAVPRQQPRLVHRQSRSQRVSSAASTPRSRSAWPGTSVTRERYRALPRTSAATCGRRCRRATSSVASQASAATPSSIATTCRRSSRR